MYNRFALVVTYCILTLPSFASKEPPKLCNSAKEWITTFEYLKAKTEFQIKTADLIKSANQVSEGCNGSSKRFIEVTDLLVRSGVSGKQAIQQGYLYAGFTDSQTQTFVQSFRTLFASDGLDLNLVESIELAKKMSQIFHSEQVNPFKDFEKLIKFCTQEKSLNLPKLQCVELASRVVAQSDLFQASLAQTYIDLIKILMDTDGVGLPIKDSIALADELIQFGPNVADNFKKAYRFTQTHTELNMSRTDAVQFAKNLAKLSKKENL